MELSYKCAGYTAHYYENEKKRLNKMVDSIVRKLNFTNIKGADFHSLASIVFVDVLIGYDGESDFDGFLYSCLEKKFKTEVTRLNREKRKADMLADSIDAYINENHDCTLGDTLVADTNIEEEVIGSEEDDGEEYSDEVKEYLKKLSPLQKKIAHLISERYMPEEICEELGITMEHYENSFKRMCSNEKIKPLKPLVNVD